MVGFIQTIVYFKRLGNGCYIILLLYVGERENFNEVMEASTKKQWELGMDEEIDSLS